VSTTGELLGLEQDALFKRFVELFKEYLEENAELYFVLIDDDAYRTTLQTSRLFQLFYRCWDENVQPNQSVLLKYVPLIDYLPTLSNQKEVVFHIVKSFRNALEELRTSQHNQGEKEGASLSQKSHQRSKPGKPADPKIQKRGEIVRKHIYTKKDFFDEEKKQVLLREFEENEIPLPRDRYGLLKYPGKNWQEIMSQSAKWKKVVDPVLERDRSPRKDKITTE